jgi:hypothetical protein
MINDVSLNDEVAMARKSKIQHHGSDNNPDMRSDAVPSGPPAKEEYKAGPGRPPKEHQFKPGQSGNPKGVKRKARSLIPDLKELFEHAFSQKVKVTRGEQEQSITMWGGRFSTPFRSVCQGGPACAPQCLLDRRKARVRVIDVKGSIQ